MICTHTIRRGALGALAITLALTVSACGGCEGDGENNANNTNNQTNNTTNNAECTPGEAECACTSEGACTDGSVCTDGQCVAASASGLSIQAEGARSCELLVEERQGRVLEVTWADGVTGTMRRRAPRVALTLMADEDAELPSSLGDVLASGEDADLAITLARCFDASGAEIANPTASIN